MIASKHSEVPKRFFTHNESLDFCATVADLHEPDLSAFFEGLLTNEISCSKKLEEIAFGRKKEKSRLFRNVPVFDCEPVRLKDDQVTVESVIKGLLLNGPSLETVVPPSY